MVRTIFEPLVFAAALTAVTACGANNLGGSQGNAATGTPIAADTDTDTATTTQQADGVGSTGARRIQSEQTTGLCLGTSSATAAAGMPIDLVDCSDASDGQRFSLDDNGLLHVSDTLCVAAGLDANSPLVVAGCSADASDQVFAIESNALVSSASALCLAPAGAGANTQGSRTIMAACDAANGQQQWAIGDGILGSFSAETAQDVAADAVDTDAQPATINATVISAAKASSEHIANKKTSIKASSMSALAAKVPGRLKAQIGNIKAAAKHFNLQPQLLVAIAMQESTGGSDPRAYSNRGGMFQFTNADTWREFGTQTTSDRQNDAISVTAAANYMGFLINRHNGSLAGALREYNGPIGQGGTPSYITDIFAKMRGKF